jgi:hypothetical protein
MDIIEEKVKFWSYFMVQKHINFVKLHYNRYSMAHVTLITIINISVVYVLVDPTNFSFFQYFLYFNWIFNDKLYSKFNIFYTLGLKFTLIKILTMEWCLTIPRVGFSFEFIEFSMINLFKEIV